MTIANVRHAAWPLLRGFHHPAVCVREQSGVQACIMRMHNPRLTCVAKDGLAARHRQCVKPDQVGDFLELGGLVISDIVILSDWLHRE